jgi:hypothetical protein
MSECNDPDHSAINAERQETRGLRRAWIELDDKRQYLEKQLREVTNQRDALAEALREIASGAYCWKTCVDVIAPKALETTKGGIDE